LLNNHVHAIVALDFFVVPTVTHTRLCVLVMLAHERRRVVHCNITEHPTAEWTAQQVLEALPWDDVPQYLLRARDRMDGAALRQRVRPMGIDDGLMAPRSPWQHPFVERLRGSIRRECLDHVVIFHARHLPRILASYFADDHRWRTPRSLAMDCPEQRPVEPPGAGAVIAVPEVGGRHHHYARRAA
jgi:putative transposase